MTAYLISSILYASALLFWRPAPESLKAQRLGFWENLRQIKASLITGLVLLFAFLFFTGGTFTQPAEQVMRAFSMNNVAAAWKFWPMQLVTHLLLHGNWMHLMSNVVAIGFLSMYERRTCARRFLMVLMVGGLLSALSVFFSPMPIIACGISGGVMALAAAYFLDHRELSLREWLQATAAFIFLAIIFSWPGTKEAQFEKMYQLSIDHLGHALGAAGGILYCRMRPLKSQKT